ncbi:ATP-grasp domain-containing protein [Mammaliicoccus sciuri]|uniref:ATP-grasp domain-containing protein n=1 Tax=Mammaliicoccus sciuri TaxID=1296 RepID=UPI003F551A1C
MSILIINTLPKHKFKYHEWIHKYNEKFVLFTLEDRVVKRSTFDKVYEFNNFDNFNEILNEVIKVNKIDKIKKIFSFEESTIILTGKLRDYLQLRGQKEEEAIRFRDKSVMKEGVKNSVKLAKYKKVSSITEINDYFKETEYPLVLKPLMGMTSHNTHIIDNVFDKTFKYDHDFLVEQFIPYSNMYHLNGIYYNNEIYFSQSFQYINSGLSYLDNKGFGSITIDPSSNIHKKLVLETDKVLKVLGRNQNIIFHCEWFLSKNELIFCEIASRPPGGRIVNAIEHSFGINIIEEYMDLDILGYQNNDKLYNFKNYIAFYYIPPKIGRILKYPNLKIRNNILDYKLNISNKYYRNITKSGENYITIVVKGASFEETFSNLLEEINYIEGGTVWKI